MRPGAMAQATRLWLHDGGGRHLQRILRSIGDTAFCKVANAVFAQPPLVICGRPPLARAWSEPQTSHGTRRVALFARSDSEPAPLVPKATGRRQPGRAPTDGVESAPIRGVRGM